MTFKNSSTSQMNIDGTIAEGYLALIESLGSQGVLITFGGFTDIAGSPSGLESYRLQACLSTTLDLGHGISKPPQETYHHGDTWAVQ